MKTTDQTGRTINIPFPPNRIVSLVPSQTELLSALGLDREVIGITKFCIHPHKWFTSKTRVGGTKTTNTKLIVDLQPDLIIANQEENDRSQIEELTEKLPVWVSNVKNLDQATDMITEVGRITDRAELAKNLLRAIKLRFETPIPSDRQRTCAYLIWNDPMMTVNKDTFIHDMLKRSGFINVFGEKHESRYPIITGQELIDHNPEILFLATEPFPFQNKHVAHFSALMPKTLVVIADGEMFSWYGSRLLHFDVSRYSF